jgi:hypothetical protein
MLFASGAQSLIEAHQHHRQFPNIASKTNDRITETKQLLHPCYGKKC